MLSLLTYFSSSMSEALIRRVKELEAELDKLKSQLRERSEAGDVMEPRSSPPPGEDADRKSDGSAGSGRKGKKAGKERPFDFSAYPRRHVALRLAYLGWSYQGFAVQENTDNTVEARLFEALLKTRLIQDRQTSNYHRCGRTDKGVSAFSQVSSLRRKVSFIVHDGRFCLCKSVMFGDPKNKLRTITTAFVCERSHSPSHVSSPQVITIDLRSTQFCEGLGVTLPENADVSTKNKAAGSDLPYLKMLNRVLPPDIRVLDWAPVAVGFSARFDCQSRTYRYYFPRGSLDVALMADAAKRWVETQSAKH